jgi:DMSO/TMAO reductase YedYZ molybdopterin-dependent catalytic subunit
MSRSRNINRRDFIRLALTGASVTLVGAACRNLAEATPTTLLPTATRTVAPTATQAAATAVATATAETVPSTTAPAASPTTLTFPPLPETQPEVLRNRNDPHYNVRYVKPLEPVDAKAWELEIDGLVDSPGSFSLEALLAWPQMEQVSRMKCVECWSFKARWGGFHYETLAQQVGPQSEASHAYFECADGYWEIVPVEELADPRVVFVLKMNDELLLDEYGAPLRMMFPAKYGYKSAKAVTKVTFTDEDGRGYWSTVGPYTVDGQIEAGYDYPQDLDGERKQIDGGEITAY